MKSPNFGSVKSSYIISLKVVTDQPVTKAIIREYVKDRLTRSNAAHRIGHAILLNATATTITKDQ